MSHRHQTDPGASVLPDEFASRLLTRASELDAAGASGASLSELRAAAAGAGISERAFDAALAELRDGEQAVVPAASAARRPSRTLVGAAVVLLTIAGIAVTRNVMPAPIDPSFVTTERILRCVSPVEAEFLILPLLTPQNTTIIRPDPVRSSTVVRIQGTSEQLRQVNAVLDRYESTGSGACPAPPTGPVRP